MKLIRFGAPGAEKPGLILDDGTRIDCDAVVVGIGDMMRKALTQGKSAALKLPESAAGSAGQR